MEEKKSIKDTLKGSGAGKKKLVIKKKSVSSPSRPPAKKAHRDPVVSRRTEDSAPAEHRKGSRPEEKSKEPVLINQLLQRDEKNPIVARPKKVHIEKPKTPSRPGEAIATPPEPLKETSHGKKKSHYEKGDKGKDKRPGERENQKFYKQKFNKAK